MDPHWSVLLPRARVFIKEQAVLPAAESEDDESCTGSDEEDEAVAGREVKVRLETR